MKARLQIKNPLTKSCVANKRNAYFFSPDYSNENRGTNRCRVLATTVMAGIAAAASNKKAVLKHKSSSKAANGLHVLPVVK